jgi:predicted secreted protein
MAKYHGRNGALLLASANAGSPSSVANLTQWSISIDTDTADVTSLGDSWKSSVLGTKSATASMSGFWADDADIPFDALDQSQSGGTVTAVLYPAGTSVNKYFTGSVWPKSVSVDDSVGGAVTFKADLVFTGTVTRVG